MKITHVEPILVALPYEDGGPERETTPGHSSETVLSLFVKVETDEGVTGWGEAFSFATVPVTIPAIADAVGPLAIGQDPTDIEAVAEDLRRRYQNMMRGGPARFALSAIEIAMWDIKGKVEGKPIWQLLGGAPRESVEAYASMFRYHEPAVVKQIAAAAWQRGYRKIKLHERTVEAVAAAREALGPRRAAHGRRQLRLVPRRSHLDGAADAALRHRLARRAGLAPRRLRRPGASPPRGRGPGRQR